MKIVGLILSLFVGSSAFAQFDAMIAMGGGRKQSSSREGFRISALAVAPSILVKTDSSIAYIPSNEATQMDQTAGAALGYASLDPGSFGWTTNISYLDIKNRDGRADMIRLDANVGYAFNSYFNMKLGPNVSKFSSNYAGSEIQSLTPALGGQVSAGFQISESIGLDVAYAQMRQSGDLIVFNTAVPIEIESSGLELSLHATF
ncbi:MAG: hypothetical protein V4736_03170 [Bdellovibrionota bacterium]